MAVLKKRKKKFFTHHKIRETVKKRKQKLREVKRGSGRERENVCV